MGVRSGDAVSGIWLYTDSGVEYKFGNVFDHTDINAPVESAYLAAIKGKQGSHSIEPLTFIWAYYS